MFKLIIKFVTRYDEDVDKVMAEAEFASKLLYYGKINVMEGMVVMEYVDGMTAYISSQLPPSFHQDLMKAIEYCHRKGFVFCDLQKPNIMITKDGKVQLINFNSPGYKGKITYPVSISPAIV
jgi:RIO-like serine/threonine protein kinase